MRLFRAAESTSDRQEHCFFTLDFQTESYDFLIYGFDLDKVKAICYKIGVPLLKSYDARRSRVEKYNAFYLFNSKVFYI